MATIEQLVGMAIDDTNNLVFGWYSDGTVTAGSSVDLSSKRPGDKYKLPTGKNPSDIAGMGIDGTNNLVFAWYRDGTVSAGTSRDLGAKRPPDRYTLPPGKTPSDIVGMGIDGKNNNVFAWYDDGTVSAGSSRELGSRRPPQPYQLAAGKSPADVVEMGIDGLAAEKVLRNLVDLAGDAVGLGSEDDEGDGLSETLKGLFKGTTKSLVFAWYRDGTVSAGSSKGLSIVRPGSAFTP